MANISEPYNIISVNNLVADHHISLRAAVVALRSIGDLRRPPLGESEDLVEWVGMLFGFQTDNVRNQREHIVLHLANAQMRFSPTPADHIDATVVRSFREKLMENYSEWCSYLGENSNVVPSAGGEDCLRCDLLYVSLYLLVWGESANLRFLPECLCFIFHHMAMELNMILEDDGFWPSVFGENAFLNSVVKPIYDIVRAEAAGSRNATAPYSAWRNYDDVNEYFWSRKCFESLGWPIDVSGSFFTKVGKTGFVEQRSFWNLYRSFERIWIMHLLFLQAAVITAWEDTDRTWHALRNRDLRVRVLSVFVTWSAMRLLRTLLDLVTQRVLVTGEPKSVGVRMFLRSFAAAAWTAALGVFYARIWRQRSRDPTSEWSSESEQRAVVFLVVAAAFVLPEILAAVLFVVPWIENLAEMSNSRIIRVLLWGFKGRIFVGRRLGEGVCDRAKYVLFWTAVLSTKFWFSYFLQIKPMVEPTKTLLSDSKLNYIWHELFPDSNRFAVALLWLPVALIYLVDMQIWYAIYTSLVGVAIGVFAHLGEIQSTQHLRLQFQYFAGALMFKLFPGEQASDPRSKLGNAFHQMKLRFGLGHAYEKLDSNLVEANKFGLVWNEIIKTFREEDIISDQELELLEMPLNFWNIRVIMWPCFIIRNELLTAASRAAEHAEASDEYLWCKISKNEYRRCAVIEVYESTKHIILSIIKPSSDEHTIVKSLFKEIDWCVEIERFTETFDTTALPRLYDKLVRLIGLLINKSERDVTGLVNTLQALYEIFVRDFFRVKVDGLAPTAELLFEEAVEFPSEDEGFNTQVRRLYTILKSRDSMQNVPSNPEARRRIAFFTNSLFMNMPRARSVDKMTSFSVLTPYYNESVLYGGSELTNMNQDGISTLNYLQIIYSDEWSYFIERMQRQGTIDDANKAHISLRLWASFRGQTLARTVRGMMYYHRALRLLAFLDSASETDAREFGRLDAFDRAEAASTMKFTYVVACQNYAKQKAEKDPRAEGILYLMKTYEALRVAYVDEVSIGSDDKDYYSVLVKYDKESDEEVEIYRIKLPGPMQIGEGKPENQNNAFVFTRGEAVQTIDMNQENYFEEALKMRNLMEEFGRSHGARKPRILGVREHIFTGPVSTLAWFMSSQESSFVTLGHRVFANVLKVRMHYGHPDVFDRLWFLTRGGLSKASRSLNINEDIFAGFNCTLRGGSITHHEYIQVGKGRDVGLNQISTFEAKIASGSGEQSLTRDVYRLGNTLDFFRMLSFFYTTVGFFFSTTAFILALYAFLWSRLYLALSGIESAVMSKNNNVVMGTILNQEFVIQLGLFTVLPMILESSLEQGFMKSIWESLMMQLQLSSVFYAFSVGTRAHFFGRTVLHGGAKYRPTGRHFALHHSTFVENYILYSRSHFVRAVELGLVLVVYGRNSATNKTSSLVYTALTISSWFIVASWALAPFVFNPSGFDWLKATQDFQGFVDWILFRGSVFSKPEKSWESWWFRELEHLTTTGVRGKLSEIVLSLRFFFFQYAIVHQLDISRGRASVAVYFWSWICVLVALGLYVLLECARHIYEANHQLIYRTVQSIVLLLTVLGIFLLTEFANLTVSDMLTSVVVFVPTGWGLLQVAQVLRPYLLGTKLWEMVVSVARLYDLIFGLIIMAPVALLSWLPGVQSMQTRILFNEAFSSGLVAFQIITGKRHRTDPTSDLY